MLINSLCFCERLVNTGCTSPTVTDSLAASEIEYCAPECFVSFIKSKLQQLDPHPLSINVWPHGHNNRSWRDQFKWQLNIKYDFFSFSQIVRMVLTSWWLLYRLLVRSCCWVWLRFWCGSSWSPFTTVMNLPSLRKRKPRLSGKRWEEHSDFYAIPSISCWYCVIKCYQHLSYTCLSSSQNF